jgi:hypothetical protein
VQVVTSSLGGLTSGVLRRVVQAVRGIPGSTERDKMLLGGQAGKLGMPAMRKAACAALSAPEEAVRVAWPSRGQALSDEGAAGKVCLRVGSLMGKETGKNLDILRRLRRLEGLGPYRNSHAKLLHPLLSDEVVAAVASAAAAAGCPLACLPHMPHQETAAASTELVDDWVYAGSANFSQSAWGAPGPQVRCNNWEVGVVLPPSIARAQMAGSCLTHAQQLLLLAAWLHSAEQTGHPSIAGATLCDSVRSEPFSVQRSTVESDPWTMPDA